MEDLWRRIEKKAGAGSLKLRGPASEEDIRLAEGTMGLTFPKDFREHLLWHDGQKSGPTAEWLAGAAPLQPLSAIVARWQEEGVPDRIPIAGTPTWDGRNIYLEPSGRVLAAAAGDEEPEVLGPSLRGLVEAHVRDLERAV